MAASEGYNSAQRNASGDESDSDYENENHKPRGLTGLQNLGNTCYLNSAIQSLSHCPPLTQFFLDCPQLISSEQSPALSHSYLKLIAELWHKKRPSYLVPSGVVSGIKAVYPMFRGYTQQDAQEFLRCLMDRLHEELKMPVFDSDDDEDDSEEEEDKKPIGTDQQDDMNNGNSSSDIHPAQATIPTPEATVRRPSFDSLSSQSELDYETCDSGLSSERGSTGENGGWSDDNNSDSNENGKNHRDCAGLSNNSDTVANTKEMKETANLLEKRNETETSARRQRAKSGMEGGDSREQGGTTAYTPVATKEGELHVPATNMVQRELTVQSSQQLKQSGIGTKSPLRGQKKPKTGKPRNVRYDSIIAQTFDGQILSSVRCLNCETVSTTKETFQDLSLPIPSKDHLHMLHSGHHAGSLAVAPPKGGTCGEVHQGWIAWMFSWMKSWFIGPTITLQDCLSAFFSADELKGDNMYSCQKCKKLRNGLKYSKVLELPEILSIHLKRFRHDFYTSKISTYISFPLEGLDMGPYLHKGCKSEVSLYDLTAIICHHGTAGGGHYTAYCLNHLNEQWYEFDDQYVTEVDVSQVQACEAYVLFYRKSNRQIENLRQKVSTLEMNETSILRFYISKQWVSKLHSFAEPGPITNKDFLCKHGGVPPGKVPLINDLVVEIHQGTWELLINRFGGGPVCNHLYACKTCDSEREALRHRQRTEKESFIQLNEEFQEEEHRSAVYAISMSWFKEWEAFVRAKTDIPPGPIDNSNIVIHRGGQTLVRQTADYGQLSTDMWHFLHKIYDGGPELMLHQSTGASVKPSSSPTPLQNVHSASQSTLQGSRSQGMRRAGSDPGNLPNTSPVKKPSRVKVSVSECQDGGVSVANQASYSSDPGISEATQSSPPPPSISEDNGRAEEKESEERCTEKRVVVEVTVESGDSEKDSATEDSLPDSGLGTEASGCDLNSMDVKSQEITEPDLTPEVNKEGQSSTAEGSNESVMNGEQTSISGSNPSTEQAQQSDTQQTSTVQSCQQQTAASPSSQQQTATVNHQPNSSTTSDGTDVEDLSTPQSTSVGTDEAKSESSEAENNSASSNGPISEEREPLQTGFKPQSKGKKKNKRGKQMDVTRI